MGSDDDFEPIGQKFVCGKEDSIIGSTLNVHSDPVFFLDMKSKDTLSFVPPEYKEKIHIMNKDKLHLFVDIRTKNDVKSCQEFIYSNSNACFTVTSTKRTKTTLDTLTQCQHGITRGKGLKIKKSRLVP